MPERTHPKRSSRAGWCLAAVVAAVRPGAAAAQVSEAVSVEYEAPPECPDRESWLAEVRARLARGRSVRSGPSSVARVSIEPSGARAHLWLDGYERAIVGADCAEVAAASALIVAVALGANPAPERRGSGASAAPPAQEIHDAPSRASAPAAGPRRTSVALAALPTPELSREPPSPRLAAAEPTQDGALASPEAASRGRWGLDVGAHSELNTWLDVGPSRGLGVSLEALAPAGSWSARAGAVYAFGAGNVGARRASLSYVGGFLDLCPLVWGGASAWRWVSCAELQLGLLQASGDGASALATPLSQQALAASAAGVTRLLTPRLWAFRLELEAGAVVPLVRNTFLFEAPEQVVFETPELGLLARAGLRVPLDGGE